MSAVETIRRDPGEILRRLQTYFEQRDGKVVVDKGGKGFTSLCPCHDDTKPSLHVALGDRCVLMKCRSCEADPTRVLGTVSIPDADGETMTPASLFYETTMRVNGNGTATPKPKPKLQAKSEPAPKPKPKPEPAKVVTMKLGSPVDAADRQRLMNAADVLAKLEAERGIDADTAQTSGLGLGTDGRIILPTYGRDGEPALRRWLAFADQRAAAGDDEPKMKGPGGAKPDLYPRPETPAYVDGSHVYLVEGEPDALCGVSHGLQVVGCPGTNGWREATEETRGDAGRFVRFGRVTVLADADTFGRKWAAKVERDLRAAGVRVVVRDFGDRVPKGFDLTDFALRCRTENAALSEAVEQLPMIVAGSQTTDLFGEPEPAQVADVGGCMFYAGATHVLFGLGGAGKTYMFLVAARDEIRNGGRVLFIDYETGSRTIRRRLDALGFTDDEKARFVHLDVARGRARPLTGDPDQITAYLDAFEPTLIGVDSWSSVHGAGGFGDVEKNEPVEDVLARVFRPLTRDDAAVVILDHFPKGENAAKGHPFGSQRKFTGTLVVMEAKVGGSGRVKVLSWKDNVGDRETKGTLLADYTYGGGIAALVPADPSSTKSTGTHHKFRPTGYMERVSKALEAAGDRGLTASEVVALDGKDAYLRAAREVLVDEGYAKSVSSDGDGVRFTTTHFVSVKPYREANDGTDHAA